MEHVGGAQDVNTFRDSSQYGLPNVSTITYEGLFNEYMFDTKTNKKNEDEKEYDEKDQLIVPTYCYAKTKKPQSLIKAQKLAFQNNETETKGIDDNIIEYYMTIGLNENFDVNKFERNNLNLIICVDHSGSMSSRFYQSNDKNDANKNKMQIANESIIALLSHLTDNDRIGIIKFIEYYTVIQELDSVKNIDIKKLKQKILQIKPGGNEDLGKVYKRSIDMFEKVFNEQKTNGNDKDKDESKQPEYSNRIIFLTDANITAGDTNPDSLCGMMKKYSDRNTNQICTTFIGVGQDFNTDFMDIVTKTNGGNYYSVHSSKQFMKTMDTQFIFMVSPLANNFRLNLLAEGNSCCIDAVFGSGDDEKAVLENGEVMNVQTVFPSPHNENDEIQGGVVLLKMKTDKNDKNGISYNMETNVSYQGVDGKSYKINDTIQFGGESMDNKSDNDYFDNSGIQKSVLLVRFVQLLKEWQQYQNKRKNINEVTKEYDEIFKEFKQYFVNEMKQIGDNKLEREIKILDKFIEWKVK